MPQTDITLIVALSENNIIGRNGDLVWRIRKDMQRFISLTRGWPVVMGRGTYDSLDAKPLPGRKNIVVTRDKFFAHLDVTACYDFESAFCEILGHEKAYIIGGEAVYNYFLPYAQTLELTRIHEHLEEKPGDKYFPQFNPEVWHEKVVEEHLNNDPPFSFVTYKRKNGIHNSTH